MKSTLSFPAIALLILVTATFATSANAEDTRPRLIVMADMGNEPDEEQQMAHLLMYANRVDIEGLIACSGKYLHADRTDNRVKVRPDLFHRLVDGYAKVVDNLALHEPEWPTADELRQVIKAGNSGYGIKVVQSGRSNEASRLIEASIVKDDPRKLYIVGNAGTNTLAQALVDLDETRSKQQTDQLCERIIVFENGAQDNSGAWIAKHYPKIAWHRSNHQTYGYGGPGAKSGTDAKHSIQGPYTWEPFERTAKGQNDWAKEHIMANHGPLGELFPPRLMRRLHFIEGGGTIPWMGLVKPGLSNPNHLNWGGWSGRFSAKRHKNIYSRHKDVRADETAYGDYWMFEADSETEKWTDPVHQEVFDNHYVPVWRFRRAMFNDFQARMDWCVNDFAHSNHSPKAVINGDQSDAILRIPGKPGDSISLDATDSSDPDNDAIQLRWWHYANVGERPYAKQLMVDASSEDTLRLMIPEDAGGKQIHVILEVWDQSEIIPLVDYRRVIVDVNSDK